jgi:FkbM family methyltransferase
MNTLIGRLGRRSGLGADPAVRGHLLTLDDLRANLPRHELEAAIRARCQAVAVDGETILCRILGRYKFFADGRDHGLSPHLILDGYWEYWCTDFMLRRIRPGQVAWDVGANLGYYALLMSDLVGPEGRVLALEPNPRLADLAARSLSLNGFWPPRAEVRRLAASDESGRTLRFRAALADPKNGRLVAGAAPAESGDAGDELDIAVRAMRLDDLTEGAVDFLKIDVEGAEEAVWRGMQRLLDRSPRITVLMEFNALRCREPEATLRDIAARFPLRELRLDAAIHGVHIADILGRTEDTLLVLMRE